MKLMSKGRKKVERSEYLRILDRILRLRLGLSNAGYPELAAKFQMEALSLDTLTLDSVEIIYDKYLQRSFKW